jgi:hypothetical protein
MNDRPYSPDTPISNRRGAASFLSTSSFNTLASGDSTATGSSSQSPRPHYSTGASSISTQSYATIPEDPREFAQRKFGSQATLPIREAPQQPKMSDRSGSKRYKKFFGLGKKKAEEEESARLEENRILEEQRQLEEFYELQKQQELEDRRRLEADERRRGEAEQFQKRMAAMEEQLERERRARIEAERRQQELRERDAFEKAESARRAEVERQREKEVREEKARRNRDVTPQALRDLREKIRQKYELDVKIWSFRHVRASDHKIVEDKMAIADGLLDEILDTINNWDENDWAKNEKEKIREIKHRMALDGKRRWKNNPPWAD